MPNATKYHGDCFPALKKSTLESLRPVKYEINKSTKK
jgi:hypothetical protein